MKPMDVLAVAAVFYQILFFIVINMELHCRLNSAK